ncbi:MAG TPA: ParB/RepB/Spo0J family partition protein [Candidatus Saccharimonadales bacterium]|nr:ParB/RepB/Spo0J family partition protein [Candidatus Saccharimonadales bacterium]
MASTQKRGLGKGFDSLVPQNFDSSLLTDEQDRVQKVLITDIKPNKSQPRTIFDQEALRELSISIKRHGVLQPVILTPAHDGGYSIIAGERRWRAAVLAKLATLPAIIRTAEELEQLEIALVENVQRVDLSPLEQAASIQRLRDQFNIEYEAIAKRLGKAVTTVQNIARLLALPDDVRRALHNKKISEGHARAILGLKDPAKQSELLKLILKNGWSVRQAERFVTAQKSGIKDNKQASARTSSTTPETKQLSKLLKTPVSIRRMAKGGKLEISFKSDAELERIIKRLS